MQKVLHEGLTSPTGGHWGYFKTLKKITESVTWPTINRDVKEFMQQCEICQRHKHETIAPPDLLQSIPILEGDFQTLL